MIQAALALIAVWILVRMSCRANSRFRDHEQLPMQWLLDGTITWSAPRVAALALTPILGTVCLTGVVAITLFLKPRPGQEGLEIPVVLFMSLVFVGAHAFHLRLIRKALAGTR